jgi:hypothetical protein
VVSRQRISPSVVLPGCADRAIEPEPHMNGSGRLASKIGATGTPQRGHNRSKGRSTRITQYGSVRKARAG